MLVLALVLATSLSLPATAVADPLADLFGFGSDAAPAAAFDEEKTVDPSTIATWQGIVQNDTENIGRIWTDKTVSSTSVQLPASPDGTAPSVDIGNSDFLVALSALSSTSNTSVTSSKPLDIVLVLDASGSMADELTSEYRYNETYNINTNGRTTYYAQNADGSYAEIDRITTGWLRPKFDHWELNGQTINPKTSAQDSDPNHIQFYTYDEVTTTKMAALHDAANAFIENTATQNDAIDDAAKRHRVSLVKFASDKSDIVGNDTMGGWNGYNYSQIMTNLTAYTSDDVASATNMVDGLTASGATSADYGMQHAQNVLASAREDAQKVVIFFTDGEPNHQNGFDGTVANDAISAAGALKDENTLVYTIGMFANADPSNTSTSTTNQFNAYMHAVSSNYPKATAWNSLGDRVSQDSAYYKAATNAAELNQIFQEISDEINAGTGYPTETTEGAEGTSGYITFIDELGAYMEVDGFKSIVFADKVFSNPVKSSNGLTDTYTFSGEGGNALYPNGNLSQIIVKVQRSDALEQGDVVTVQVPADLIPLRNFTVKDENGTATMDIAEAYPIRIFYGVSVKQGVCDALAQGTADQALKNYIAANTVDGKTSFYSNYYDGTVTTPDGSKKLGNTTASFVPAEGNSFYYFTENTTLYTDESCTQKVMDEPHAGETYYYKRVYYAKGAQSGEVAKKDSITRFVGANFEASTTFWGKASDGSYYIKAGAPRLTRIDDLTLAKENNATGTSTEVINPNWDNINNPDVLNVSLGNNGKISVELPGTLAITKDAGVVPNKGLSTDVLNGKEFQFEITVDGAANKTYKAEVKHEDGTVTGTLFDLAFDGQGKATHSIKDNETLYIYGLDAGVNYSVTEVEDKLPSGFTQTSASGDTGTILGNATAQAKFVNTYDVAPVTLSAVDFATYQKNFDRWDIASSFNILLTEDNAANPMPEGSAEGADGLEEKTVQVSEGATSGNFGDITFDHTGTFTYTITEPGASGVAGMTYSQAAYSVTVTVTDKGDGTLEATSAMKRVSNDAGADVDEDVANKNAAFTNSFSAASVNIGSRAVKIYTNNGGADKNLVDGMFAFKVTAVGDNAADAPMPADVQADTQGNRYVTVVNDGPEVAFGQATFDETHVGSTYTYEIREVLPDGATAENGYTVNGMTYDNSYYTATFTVSSEEVNGTPTVKVERSYTKGDDKTSVASAPSFTNSYDPTDVTLEGAAAINVSKTLVGRDSLKDESFGFTLVARGNITTAALENHEIVFAGDENKTELKASVDGLEDGKAKTANFDSVTFTEPGTYSFNVTENAPAADTKGMVYDRSTKVVTVVVTDDNGTLKASVTYPDGASAAAFTNTYTASHIYGTGMKLDAGKTLDGRAQNAGEFEFTIKGVDKIGSVAAADAESKLAESDKSFSTIADAPDGVQSKMFNLLSGVKFTQDDAGKTFSYELAEVEGSLAGVTYDKTVYSIDITPVDNADGTMHAVTHIGKTMTDGTDDLGEYSSASGVGAVTLGFANVYEAASVTIDPATTPIDLSKVLMGRDWKASDSFEFTLTSENADGPSYDVATKIVTQVDGTPAGTEVSFNFGSATFDTPGQYHYTVTETNGGKTIDGVTYDGHTADIYVIVSDPGDGQLTAQVNVYNGTFTNDYKAELNHNDAGGIVVTKTTNGHSMERGQFQFRVEALDGDGVTAAETAQRIGITDGTTGDFGNIEGADGEKVEMPSEHPIAFTQADVGKTFKLKISERGADGITFGSGGAAGGYTYSDAVYTVELSVADKGDGTLELTTKVTDKDGKTTEQTSSAADAQATYLDFVNAYEAVVPAGRPVTTENLFSKVLNGRDWKASDSFTFTITPQGDAPASERANATLTGLTDAAGSQGNFGFGKINFTFDDVKDVAPAADGTRTKDFVYKVTENIPAGDDKIAGIDYDTREVTLTVTLTDDGKGSLAASYNVANGPFVNTYASGAVNVDAAGGVQVVKTLTGRAIAAGDFAFTMTATSDDAKVKFGKAKTVQTAGAALGTGADANIAVETVKLATGLTFGLEDVGKSFAFDVVETRGGGNGYVNDATVHKLTFEVSDDGAGTLTVTAKLDGNPDPAAIWTNAVARAMGDAVSIPFVNRYDAGFVTVGGDGDVALAGVKQLIGRDMVAGEFHFNVTNAADDAKRVVATGVNAADGTVSFTGITYTTEQLNKDVAAGLATVVRAGNEDVYTYDYSVSEDASKNAAGITVIQGAQAIKVKVTDDHEGKLSAEVVYPDGGMVFRNAYGAGAEARISLVGAKVLEVESGDNAPDIAGKFTFTLTGSEGAPMPVKTTTVNEESGSVSFGELVYTIDCLEGAEVAADGTRSKTFTYTVNESGSVAGVVNDAIAKTIEVTVKDNGDGTLSAIKSTVGDTADFTFVNVYRVEPTESSLTGEGGFDITKTLTGRDMRAGEFEFSLEVADGTVVTASNDASGKVVFPVMRFTEPGTYKYALAEIDGELGGVTYDDAAYEAVAKVIDKGDGTLGVTWSVSKDGELLDGKDVVFANTYRAEPASISLGAAKKLTGRDIVEGEFSFELRDVAGNVLQTVTNGTAEDGVAPVVFAPIVYDAPGEYDYQIVEVVGDAEGVTYDEAVFACHVSVTDDGVGHLEATLTQDDASAFVFENVYVAPPAPEDPATPVEPLKTVPALVKTGDAAPALMMALGAAAAVATAVAAVGLRRLRSRRG